MIKERAVFAVCLCVLTCTVCAPAAQAQTAGWTPIGPDRGTVFEVAVDPQHPSTVYAGAGSGVFKSLDGGANWATSSSGLPASQVSALAIDPAVPSHVFAGTFGAGVFESNDGGASWTALNDQLPNLFVKALATDSTSTL